MRGAVLALGLILAAALPEPGMSRDSSLFERLPETTRIARLPFAAIPGWSGDDHAAALSAFRVSCAPLLDGKAALRDALPPSRGLIAACRAALSRYGAEAVSSDAARAFFEAEFTAFDIIPVGGLGFLTAYYEPEVEASLERSAAFPVPVLGRPVDLVTIPQGGSLPGIPASFAAARLREGAHEIYPDRAAIWSGALAGQGLEIAWLRDEAELFIIQVQGSARLRLADGRATRLVYAGRNGHPYTSIGKILVDRGDIPLAEMSLARLMGWLRADPAKGRALMEQNRSYVFFARDDAAPAHQGPIGGAGVPLTTGRSLAIDRSLWPYGLPVWIATSPLTPDGPRAPLDRLMIAQDTGSAIVGPARGDFFMGSGDAAGAKAGLVRDAMRFIVLVPNGDLK
jgi:membrane-bound lytic murein transglycosylase A